LTDFIISILCRQVSHFSSCVNRFHTSDPELTGFPFLSCVDRLLSFHSLLTDFVIFILCKQVFHFSSYFDKIPFSILCWQVSHFHPILTGSHFLFCVDRFPTFHPILTGSHFPFGVDRFATFHPMLTGSHFPFCVDRLPTFSLPPGETANYSHLYLFTGCHSEESSSASYPIGPRFDCWSGGRLCLLIFVIFLSTTMSILEWHLETGRFLSHHFKFIIHCNSPIRSYVTYGVETSDSGILILNSLNSITDSICRQFLWKSTYHISFRYFIKTMDFKGMGC